MQNRIIQTLFLCLLCFSATTSYAFTLMGDRTHLFEKHLYQSETGDAEFDYYLLKPQSYDLTKQYPLVLTLHGASGHSYGAYALASDEFMQKFPAFVLVPRIQLTSWTLPKYDDVYPEPSKHIMTLLDTLMSDYSIDQNRVYVTGYSVGGYGSFSMAAEYNTTFAATVPLCGGGQTTDAAKLKDMAVWVFHGAQDKGIPVENSRKMVQAIKAVGGTPNYTEFPDLAHNIWDRVYEHPEFWRWLFAQKRDAKYDVPDQKSWFSGIKEKSGAHMNYHLKKLFSE